MTAPFDYPSSQHVRRHGPSGYADYESYRPWLRDEFAFRCVYCLIREQWGPLKGSFSLDHFLPVASYLELLLDYDNLLYCCTACNLSKANRPTPDPLAVLLSGNVKVAEDGSLLAATAEVGKLLDLMGLDRPRLRETRALWIRIVRLATHFDPDLLKRLLTFPADLPDISQARPPGGNSRPEGVGQSHHARRERGELPDTY